MKRLDIAHVALLVAAGLLFLSYGFTEMAGSDMWWHIAAGRELLQTGTPWMVDDWSFTAHGHDWHNHEWLSDLIFYAWVSVWGVPSIVYWKWLVIVATFLLLLLALQRETGSATAALVGAAIAVANAAPFLDIRPHLYSLMFFSALLYSCLRRRPSPWLLVPLFVVWVNMHGGFFFGLMALGILVFPWRELSWKNLRGAVLLGLFCALACLVNPSGLQAFLYPLAYAFDGSSPYRELGEWLSPFLGGGIAAPLFFYFMWLPLLGLLYLIPAVRRTTDVPWEGIALTLLTLAMALTSRRFIPLFGISLAVMITPLLGAVLRRPRLQRLAPAFAILALLVTALRLLPFSLQAKPNFHYLAAEYSYPVEMMNFVEANQLSGKVYALYNWGGYIHWRTDGQLKVYIDGRADTVYGAQPYLHYLGVLNSEPGWLDSLEATEADYILWPHQRGHGQRKLRELVATGRWRPIYSDAVSWLLAREGIAQPAQLVATPPGPWRDLAIARTSGWSGNNAEAIRYAKKVREVIPWHKDACELLVQTYRKGGEVSAAQEALLDCRGYFPSVFLR
jgi:hypothetical protein